VQGALLAMRILARKYEFRDEEERDEIKPVVTQVRTLIYLEALLKPYPGEPCCCCCCCCCLDLIEP